MFRPIVPAIPKSITASIAIVIPPIRRTDTPVKLLFFSQASAPRAWRTRSGVALSRKPPVYYFERCARPRR